MSSSRIFVFNNNKVVSVSSLITESIRKLYAEYVN